MNNQLIKKILQKKELSGTAKEIVKELLIVYLKKHRISLKNISPKQQKIIIKEIRSQLRDYTGQFQKSQKNRQKLFEKDKIQELLKTHTSTAERLNFYPKLKKIISKLKIKSILDLGCGLNPIALANKKIIYYASDIKENELSLIKDYFKKNKLKGKTFIHDITKTSVNLPRADLCLIFKTLDIFPKKQELTEKILNQISCKYFLISFPTQKLSGKQMNKPKRIWFESILNKQFLSFSKFNSENEIFYLIKQHSESKTI